MRIDLHTHSNVSDGTDTPTTLVHAAISAGLDVIALTDHDTFAGVAEAQEAGRRSGLKVLNGLEMSTKFGGESVHLLGYGCDPRNADLKAELARIRAGRTERLPRMIEQLQDNGIDITVDEVYEHAGDASAVGRPHVADILVKKGVVATRAEAFKSWIGVNQPGYAERYACPLEEAIDLIHSARGVAIIAHPWSRESRAVLTAPVLERLVLEHQLDGIEVDHQDHDMDTRELLFEMGARLGLIRTGSSDYHGKGKVNHELGCNLTRVSAYNELVSRIRRRGGVV
ncbi:PHP domain-containing protein [Tessaracoccus sp. OH4464_COT-324]|uniref:PHP domain-containing protein n=1 Tax=Tessaracoccus sp. OH4464_COT-324 TaxID=2491059 RepID=UPI000F63B694|nr:PHP domain-containing protein [Tessaracoccus sp. OH4464_COT-324]RRD47418.1 PHP domain-containing protein [Tessaracoccus sp. OH4464_COT-324]